MLTMHIPSGAILFALLLAPIASRAAEPAYSPKFARVETSAAFLGFDACQKPEYPRASMRNEETGVTVLGFAIAPTGVVLGQTLLRSSGFRDLDRAAQKGLFACSFRPATINGVPVQSTTLLQYVWTLE